MEEMRKMQSVKSKEITKLTATGQTKMSLRHIFQADRAAFFQRCFQLFWLF